MSFKSLVSSTYELIRSKQQKELLHARKAQLNPFELKKNLEQKLKEFFEIYRKETVRKVA